MKNTAHCLIFIYGLILLPSVLMAQVNAENRKIDELVKAYVDINQFNGNVLVAKKGEITYQ